MDRVLLGPTSRVPGSGLQSTPNPLSRFIVIAVSTTAAGSVPGKVLFILQTPFGYNSTHSTTRCEMTLFQSLTIEPGPSFSDAPPALVMKLAPGEREVATIVYQLGGCTAKEIQARLAKPLANATVRSMLRRLVGKGIITQRPKGTYRTFVYLPAVTNEYVRQQALMRLAQDHFEGSLPTMVATLVQLLDRKDFPNERRSH